MKKGSTTGGGGGGGGDRRQETGEDTFFVWPSSLDHLTSDLLSLGNGPAAVPFSHGRKFLLPLLQGRGD